MDRFDGAAPVPAAVVRSGAGRKGLRAGALGLFSSVTIGLASTAPAYSMASALGVVVVALGLQTPVGMVLAFVPMLLIAYAYKELNAIDADCGTTFIWASRAFGPRVGWMGGWGIIVADVIFMANIAEIAGRYGFRLVGLDSLAASRSWTTAAGVVWIVAMTAVCYVGIEVSARLQRWLVCVEVALLVLFAVAALVRVYGGNPGPDSIHVAAGWFDPFRIPSPRSLTTGILAAVIIYWGWDTAVSVNEETANSRRTPGRAAVLCTVLLLVLYTLVTTAAQSFAGIGTQGTGLADPAAAGDVFSGLGRAVFGAHGAGPYLSRLLIFMVLTSSVAATLTTILPTARTVFSMAAHRAVPARFARLHARYLTPTWSTVGMGAASLGVLLLLTAVSRHILSDTIESVGLAIAFYYGLTGFACAWYYRRLLTRSVRDLLAKGVLPGLGGLIMLFLFCYAAFDVYADPRHGTTSLPLPLVGRVGGVTVLGLGALLLGVVLMLVVTREHTATLRLQRGLLPQELPAHPAGELAARYLPADSRSGVGGDWYDVVPLSSARLGLVVGDVLGYGLRAAATMGSLRTSLRALARLDLEPDELLTHLGDLVGRQEHGAEGFGVTCLYAVYDPVTGRCTMAAAGHLPPLVLPPDAGSARSPDLPAGHPLGAGGSPFRSTEWELPEHSLIAFFTNGLVCGADRDAETGTRVLAQVLSAHAAHPAHAEPLDALADSAVTTLLPGPVDDDAALLLMRARRLPADRLADWQIPPDPGAVADARAAATRQLTDWGLDELAFTTELVVSELVTNAIRYSAGPIRLRLIRDGVLTCEVADTGHTSPHLRHAATDEEGGRGLYIIAQLTDRWGTRYTSTGKTIWVEQSLDPAGGPEF